jgi:hypothetical protein
MEFYKKYSHVGYSYLNVNDGWKPIVKKAVIEIEKEMWVKWLPFFIKRWIHYLAYGRSVYYIKFRIFYKLRNILTNGNIITDIKDKYATLRIYGFFNNKINFIIEKAEKECDKTCEKCGSRENVSNVGKNWIYNYCKKCAD